MRSPQKFNVSPRRSETAARSGASSVSSRLAPNDRSAARDLRRCKDILREVASVSVEHGYTGEGGNRSVMYLAAVSRLLARPVNVFVTGASSSGKTNLVESVTRLLPSDAVWALASASPRALVYSSEPLKHRVLVLAEADGFATQSRGSGNDIGKAVLRSLLSENRIAVETTVRTRGRMTTEKTEREGPTCAFITACRGIDNELANRCMVLRVDESPEQLRRVERSQARLAAGLVTRSPAELAPFLDLQAVLSRKAPYEVIIPFAEDIRCQGPMSALWNRKYSQILTLIKAHAVLHQCNRRRDDRDRIVATADDYRVVQPLISKTLNVRDSGPTGQTREAIRSVERLMKEGTPATLKAVGNAMGVGRSTVQAHLEQATKRGYLTKHSASALPLALRLDAPAQASVFVPAEPLPETRELLPRPETIEASAGNGRARSSRAWRESRTARRVAAVLEQAGISVQRGKRATTGGLHHPDRRQEPSAASPAWSSPFAQFSAPTSLVMASSSDLVPGVVAMEDYRFPLLTAARKEATHGKE